MIYDWGSGVFAWGYLGKWLLALESTGEKNTGLIQIKS